MPYTDPTWDPEVPADGDLLSQGDDVIRAEKLDIKERVESFFKSIDGDPWVPKDKSIPAGALADGAVTVDALDPALNLRSIILTTVAWSGTIAAGAFVLNSFTVTGAEPGDFIVVNFPDNPGFLITMTKITATDTVGIAIYNNFASGSITLTNATIQVCVIKQGIPGQLHGNLSPMVPFTEFKPADASIGAVYTVSEIAPAAIGALTLYASLTVTTGDTIADVNVRVRSDNTAAVTAKLWKNNGGVTTQIGTTMTATVGAGLQTLTISPAYKVVEGDELVFEIVLDSTGSTNANDARLSWASLTLT